MPAFAVPTFAALFQMVQANRFDSAGVSIHAPRRRPRGDREGMRRMARATQGKINASTVGHEELDADAHMQRRAANCRGNELRMNRRYRS